MGTILSFFGSIFGSQEAKLKAIEIADNLHLSDEEETKYHLEQLEKYVPFVLAQRFLAIGTFVLYSLYFIIFLVYTVFGGDTSRLTDFAEATQIQNIFLAVMLFYFNSGYIKDTLNTFMNKSKK